MKNQTIVNGIVYSNYDKVCELIEELKKGFINQKDYKGYPNLPDCYLEVEKLYNNSTENEKKFIFNIIYTQFLEALRHWTVDKDCLYNNKNVLDEYKDLIQYMKKGWDKFWY